MANNPFQTPPAPATPWPLPPTTMGTLFTTGSDARATLLQNHWASPTGIYSGLQAAWNSTTDSAAISGFGYALKYLATGNTTYANNAVTAALGEAYAADGQGYAMWCDSAPFVYCWCNPALNPTQKGNLIAQIETNTGKRETAISALGAYALDGPGNTPIGIAAYVFGCIAGQGQSGFTDRRTNLRNFVQNVTNYFLETYGDGNWGSYDALAVPNWNLILAYHIATGEESLLASRFPWFTKRGEVLLRRLGPNQNKSFFWDSHCMWYDQTGTAFTSQYPDEPWAAAMYSQVMKANGGSSQTIAITKYFQSQRNTHTINNNPWTNLSYTNNPTWTALMFSDDSITPVDPASANLPLCNFFKTNGIAEFRAGWNQSTDLVANFFCGHSPVADHNYNKSGSILLRVGGTWLIKNGTVYAGAGSGWENASPVGATHVGTYSMTQSGPSFCPTASLATRPDRDGSNKQGPAPANSATLLPLSNVLTNSVRQTWASGVLDPTSFYDDGQLAKISGDYTSQFATNSGMTSSTCTFGYQRGSGSVMGTFIIRDVFVMPGTGDIRRNFFSFNKPTISGETVVLGSTTAGVLTATGTSVVITNGSYQVTIQWVSNLLGIDVMGGSGGASGYDGWYDSYPALSQGTGGQQDYQTLSSWTSDPGHRPQTAYSWLANQWRTSFRTSQATAGGEMLCVLTVQAAGGTAPTYTHASALALLNPGAPVAMPGNSQYWNAQILNATTGKSNLVSPTLYAAACTTLGTDGNVGFVEPSGFGYARKQMAAAGADWNTAAVATPATVTNANDILWPAASGGDWGQILGVAFYDAATAGHLICSDYLGSQYWSPFTCNLASPGVLTCDGNAGTGHGFTNGQTVAVTTKFNGSLPTLSAGSWSGLLTVQNATTTTFTLQTAGAVALNTSSQGSGSVRLVVPVTITNGNTLRIVAGSQTIAQQ